jgi:hypothetical protein
MEPIDQFYGRSQRGLEDPAGNQWSITTREENVSEEELANCDGFPTNSAAGHIGQTAHVARRERVFIGRTCIVPSGLRLQGHSPAFERSCNLEIGLLDSGSLCADTGRKSRASGPRLHGEYIG